MSLDKFQNMQFLKELCINKRMKLKGDVEVGRNVSALIKSEKVSPLIRPTMPKKCSKCNFDVMLDLGVSINSMPSSVYRSLRLSALESIGIEHCTSAWHFARRASAS
ncbi:hypothetical protein CR513_51708, partial [Mucuna pruriens]